MKTRMIKEIYHICNTCGLEIQRASSTYPRFDVGGILEDDYCSLECEIFAQYPTKDDYLKDLKKQRETK